MILILETQRLLILIQSRQVEGLQAADSPHCARPDRAGKNHHPAVAAGLRKRTREEIADETERKRAVKRVQDEERDTIARMRAAQEELGLTRIAALFDKAAQEDQDEAAAEREPEPEEVVEGGEKDTGDSTIDGDGDVSMIDVSRIHARPVLTHPRLTYLGRM